MKLKMKKAKELVNKSFRGHAVVCYTSGRWEEVMIDFNFQDGRYIDYMPQTGYCNSMRIEWNELTEIAAYPVNTYDIAIRAIKAKLPLFVLDMKSKEIRKYYGGKKDRIAKSKYGTEYILLIHKMEDYLKLFKEEAIPYKTARFMSGMEVNLHREEGKVVQCKIIEWKDYGYYQKFTLEIAGREEELSCMRYGEEYWFTSK